MIAKKGKLRKRYWITFPNNIAVETKNELARARPFPAHSKVQTNMRKYKNMSKGFLILVLISCTQTRSDFEILPLHPYSTNSAGDVATKDKSKEFVVKTYFIKGAKEISEQLENKVDSFVHSSIKQNINDLNSYGSYYIYFYKASESINENYRETGTDDNLDSHSEDLLFVYNWSGGEFSGCHYYKGGKRVKTVLDKKGEIYKHSPISNPDTSEVILKKLPAK
jgi:hypothetical protein